MSKKIPLLIQRTDGIARKPERRVITGVPDTTWDKLEQQGLAPRRVHLGPRCVGWPRASLLSWVEARIAESEDAWQQLGHVAQRIIDKAGPR